MIEELIKKIKESVNIVNIAKQNFSLTKKGMKYLMRNPLSNEKSESVCINEELQTYYSFSDGFGGDIIDFVMIFLNKTFYQAIEYIISFSNFPIEMDKVKSYIAENNDSKEFTLRVNKDAAIYFYYVLRRSNDKNGIEYFSKKRQLSDDTMRKFGLGFAPNSWDSLIKYLLNKGYTEDELKMSGLVTVNNSGHLMDKFRNRVIIPIFDINNKVIAFGGRVLDDSKPKYLNSPDTIAFDKSKNLYALNIAKDSKRDGFIACEGYMDVISMHQAGFDNAIASLGTAFTDKHAFLIKTLRNKVYLAYDSDAAGVDATIKAIKTLDSYNIESFVINMRPYKDPDEFIKALGADEYQKRIDAAMPSKEFLLRKMSDKVVNSSDEEKEKSLRELALKISDYYYN